MEYSVFLRPFVQEDAYKIYDLRHNKKVQKNLMSKFNSASIEIEKKWVYEKMMNNQKDIYFAICLNDPTKEMIGYFCIRDIDYYNKKAHMGATIIDPKFQDGTYAIDVSLIALNYAFINLGLNRVTGITLKENYPSRCIMEVFGFQLEGIESQSIYKDHKFHDVCRYALLYDNYISLLNNGDYSLSKIAKKARQIKQSFNIHYK